jgi:hypothetical protein
VKYAVNTAVQFVQHHAAAIVSFVASTAVFMGCEAAVTALTAGAASLPGAVGCSALAGAVGNAVTYAMTTPVSKWSLGGFASTALEGAAVGAAGGLLGPLGSKLLGPVVDAVASRLGPALVDDAADAVADVADSTLDSAASDVGTAADSSASDASAASDSGAADPSTSEPASSEPASSEPTSSEPATSEDQATTCSVNSFVGSTKVLLANGRQRVRAADPHMGTSSPRRIIRVIRHSGVHAMVAITLVGGFVIRATAHHLLWDATGGRFAYASALKPGTRLAEPGGRLIAITKTRAYRASITAYNLSISGIHTYYVVAGPAAVLVHNSCPSGSQAGANTLRQRAETLNNLIPGGRRNMTTTAIRVWNRVTGDYETWIGINGPGKMPAAWRGLLGAGEKFIQGVAGNHAEENVLSALEDPLNQEWMAIEGGTSRGICYTHMCWPMINWNGMNVGGPTFRATTNSLWRMFWRP